MLIWPPVSDFTLLVSIDPVPCVIATAESVSSFGVTSVPPLLAVSDEYPGQFPSPV